MAEIKPFEVSWSPGEVGAVLERVRRSNYCATPSRRAT